MREIFGAMCRIGGDMLAEEEADRLAEEVHPASISRLRADIKPSCVRR